MQSLRRAVDFRRGVRNGLAGSAEAVGPERVELVEHLIYSVEHEIDLLAKELSPLGDALADADRAVELQELIPGDEVVALMREMS